MTQALVSIIIVNYNSEQLLQKCLSSLTSVSHPNVEIILIDNNSDDDSVDLTRKSFPNVIILKLDSNRGFAEPNNIASKIAKGKYLLFLNNDTIVTPNFISEMVEIMEKNNDIGICQSLLLKPDGSIDSSGDFMDNLGVAYNSKTPISKTREISSARGASMLIKKSIFEKIGGFDKQFFVSFEDVDLGWRCWICGYRVVVVPKSIVYHTGGQTIRKMEDKIAFHAFKNQLSMKLTNFEKSLGSKIMIKFLIIYGIRKLRVWFDYSFKGKTTLTSTRYDDTISPRPKFSLILKGIIWIIQNKKYINSKRRLVDSLRVLSTKELQNRSILSDIPK